MSLNDEQQRARFATRKHRKRIKRHKKKWQSALEQPLALANPHQVLTFFEWCQLNRISARTGRRILDSGTGPPVVQLAEKRIGITVGANAAWQASRSR
jgi:hypothetical protein